MAYLARACTHAMCQACVMKIAYIYKLVHVQMICIHVYTYLLFIIAYPHASLVTCVHAILLLCICTWPHDIITNKLNMMIRSVVSS